MRTAVWEIGADEWDDVLAVNLRGVPERIEGLAATIPVGRLGTADEVGALAAFLTSEDAGFITGACLDVNGGLLMR